MKIPLMLLGLMGAASTLLAQTNSPVAPSAESKPASAPAPAAASPAEATSSQLTASTATTSAASSSGTKVMLLEPKAPVDGIEGKKVNYTGAAPKAIKGGGFRGVLNLFNPFAKLSDAEKRQPTGPMDRPLPRGFVDDRTMQPEGLKILSVEQK